MGRKRSKIEWAMWANVLGLQAAFLVGLGGLLDQFQPFTSGNTFGAYAIAISFVIALLEYPRGQRMAKGHSSIPRSYQDKITPIVAKLGFFSRNYFFRAIFLLLACVPMFFAFPLVIGGTVLALSGLVYFLAALLGEEWLPIAPAKEDEPRRPVILQAPTKPPPRLPPRLRADAAPAQRANAAAEAKPADARPRPPLPSDLAPPPPPRLALAQWFEAKDPASGQKYYINAATGEATWDRPSNMLAEGQALHMSSES